MRLYTLPEYVPPCCLHVHLSQCKQHALDLCHKIEGKTGSVLRPTCMYMSMMFVRFHVSIVFLP
jgi:hypothetical protein